MYRGSFLSSVNMYEVTFTKVVPLSSGMDAVTSSVSQNLGILRAVLKTTTGRT